MRSKMLENFKCYFYGWYPCFQNYFLGYLASINCAVICSSNDDFTFEFNIIGSFNILEFD